MTINEFAAEVHKNAVDHGWWEGERTFPEIVALIHSEVSEALEEYRDGKAAFRIISRVSLKVSPYWKPRQAGFKVPKYQTWKAPSNICTGSRTAAGVLGGTSIFNERAQTAPQERSYSI